MMLKLLKLYKYAKALTALVLALLLVTTVMEITLPLIAGGMLCKLAGLMLGGTLCLYALKTLNCPGHEHHHHDD